MAQPSVGAALELALGFLSLFFFFDFVDELRWVKPVRPGDTLLIDATLT